VSPALPRSAEIRLYHFGFFRITPRDRAKLRHPSCFFRDTTTVAAKTIQKKPLSA
jgi:hypothetical protein